MHIIRSITRSASFQSSSWSTNCTSGLIAWPPRFPPRHRQHITSPVVCAHIRLSNCRYWSSSYILPLLSWSIGPFASLYGTLARDPSTPTSSSSSLFRHRIRDHVIPTRRFIYRIFA
ncbi:hypothetical protein CC80DRAFT_154660 [Byssothecium circinans]|uniref:Uncharacterized protein n=1 Tax=Byssothecium circinans TaxID=147558 RepID=A0A6A5UAC4_9PLEO|nr:hypothetical protein CC80DRAFT_154660 [Byssothecium circinans]